MNAWTRRLSCARLADRPHYNSLSYSWGTDKVEVDITINDNEFRVQRNLHTILQRLRQPEGSSPMVIWIDAICINQHHDPAAIAERSAQVQMMATIYSLFRLLGRGDDAKALEEYAADFTKNPEDLDYAFNLACFFYLLKDAGKKVNLAKYALPPFWGVDDSKALARYGIPATSEEFRKVYAHLFYSHALLRDVIVAQMAPSWRDFVWLIMSMQTKALAERRKRTLFDECVEFRDSEATVPLDKVFAIISFMAFLGMQLPMEIDYGQDTRDVFIQVSADHVLTSSGGSGFEPLAPLRFSREKNKYPNLPSWVVDWTSYPRLDNHRTRGLKTLPPGDAPWLQIDAAAGGSTLREGDVDPPTRLTVPRAFNASKGMRGTAPPSISGTRLGVSGIQIDTVEGVIDFADGPGVWTFVTEWLDCRPFTKDYRLAVLRTLSANMLQDKPLGGPDWEMVTVRPWWVKLCARAELAGEKQVEATVGKASRSLSELAGHMLPYWERGAAKSDDEAKVFDLLRLWVGDVLPGDTIYLLHQGATPFVLRPGTGTAFRVISECYVDGCMNGEAADVGPLPEYTMIKLAQLYSLELDFDNECTPLQFPA
ncbi:heterokaryon incompatibility protein-domain-containing protein [Lasiosphaeria miniovina]|uniref:Heterokaryon incompatibility protein-domain-containing protein n=1 Tax=Lasiosphaeria miniovina TaxID=1954250 RepID=A0AA40AJ79_9PEZI|nr:heterokaryon incompatibility protein-domain-containing protein [Lasiosphaeria miniovina]KAK0716873.1 heterokaryon incompatibility protein-domain-containing protein [Lasiosphaeria miniovina]